MNNSREESAQSAQQAQPTRSAQPTWSARSARPVWSMKRPVRSMKTGSRGVGRTVAARGPWTVLCAVAAVVLGPAAATASALEQANKAPLHHAVRIDRSQAYLPADSTRRRPAA